MSDITSKFDNCQTIEQALIVFMECTEEWQSLVEGTPTDSDLAELDKIYAITEVQVKYIVRAEDNSTKNSTDELLEAKQ